MVSRLMSRSAVGRLGVRAFAVRNAPACQLTFTVRVARTALTKLPAPGLLSTRPRLIRVRMARCTVTGLASYRATRVRLDGSCAPGPASRIHSRRSATIRSALPCPIRGMVALSQNSGPGS